MALTLLCICASACRFLSSSSRAFLKFDSPSSRARLLARLPSLASASVSIHEPCPHLRHALLLRPPAVVCNLQGLAFCNNSLARQAWPLRCLACCMPSLRCRTDWFISSRAPVCMDNRFGQSSAADTTRETQNSNDTPPVGLFCLFTITTNNRCQATDGNHITINPDWSSEPSNH